MLRSLGYLAYTTFYLNAGGVEYYNPSSVRLPGEWILIDCDVLNRPNATLSFKPDGIQDTIYDLPIDHEKIKLTSKNVFNITRLTHHDSGEYTCDFNGQQSNATIGKRGQKVIVLNKGNIEYCVFGPLSYK